MKARIAVSLLIGVAIVLACFDNPSSPQRTRSGGSRAHSLVGQERRPRTLDDVYADIASAESTFGGFFFDSMHVPVVYLTDTTRLVAARAAGLDAFLSKRRTPLGNLRVLPARYGFGALRRWYSCAMPRVLSVRGAVSTDIDEAGNRLRFGVATQSVRGDVQAVLTECDVPADAVVVEVVPPVRRLGALNETAQDSVRPLRGGIRVRWSPNQVCTLGVIGHFRGGLAFLTAGHCSHTIGAVDTTSYWQNVIGASTDSIGRETLDPAYFSGGDCPETKLCRYSDVNLSILQTSASAVPGAIARMLSPSHNPSYEGSKALDSTHPGLFITATDTIGPAIGDTICKAGQTTGITCGATTATLQNLNVYDDDANQTYYFLFGQNKVHARTHNGDSGSPVFAWASSADSTVVFEGILWAGESDATFIYSKWGELAVDVTGSYDSLNVVADSLHFANQFGARVDGPLNISAVPDTFEWNAHAFGGTGSYSYLWKYKNNGTSTFLSLGTSQSQKRYLTSDSTGFTIRAIMVSGSDTITRDTVVDVNPITSLDLSGTSWVHAGMVCHWTATPVGGFPPYIFSWQGGAVVDTTMDADTFGVYVLENFSVDVTVTDVNGAGGSNSLYVYVDESAPGC